MELGVGQLSVFVVCILFMLGQLLVKNKQLIHLLFAVFCGSMAMIMVYRMMGDSWGIYKYIVGMGAFATCNGYWLVAREMFRGPSAIERPHLLFASVVGVLIILRQGINIVDAVWLLENVMQPVKTVMTEAITLFSSAMLVLSFWEGYQGYDQLSVRQQRLRKLYLSAFCVSVGAVLIFSGALPKEWLAKGAREWLVVGASLIMLSMTQYIIWQKQKELRENDDLAETPNDRINEGDEELAEELEVNLVENKSYLQPNLKVADLARALDVPEYRVRTAVRNKFDAKNFNQLVNQLRVEHAKKLLVDEGKSHWPVLVVGIESGFASAGPFTRAFKQFTGTTPNQYRKTHVV